MIMIIIIIIIIKRHKSLTDGPIDFTIVENFLCD